MGKIILKNVRCYSFHGCLKEESVIGSDYLVNLKVWASLKKSAHSDKLVDTALTPMPKSFAKIEALMYLLISSLLPFK